jgi:hypothetical protein
VHLFSVQPPVTYPAAAKSSRESIETREPHAAAPKKERRATYKVELTVRLLFYMASAANSRSEEEEGIHITDTFN